MKIPRIKKCEKTSNVGGWVCATSEYNTNNEDYVYRIGNNSPRDNLYRIVLAISAARLCVCDPTGNIGPRNIQLCCDVEHVEEVG